MEKHDSISKLIVEDDPVTSAMLMRLFDRYGIKNVKIVNTAADFRDKYTKEIEICVVDYILPDSTGEELIEFISNINHRCRIIIMSAYFTEDILLDLINMGAHIMGVKKKGDDWIKTLIKLMERACEGVLKDRKLLNAYENAKHSII